MNCPKHGLKLYGDKAVTPEHKSKCPRCLIDELDKEWGKGSTRNMRLGLPKPIKDK